MLDFAQSMPGLGDLLGASVHVARWYEALTARDSFIATAAAIPA